MIYHFRLSAYQLNGRLKPMEKAFHLRCVREKEGFKTLCRKGFGVGDQSWKLTLRIPAEQERGGRGSSHTERGIFNVYALDFSAL
jgi:hypothetical protein